MTSSRNFLRTFAAATALAFAATTAPVIAQTGGPGDSGDHVDGYRQPYGEGCGATFMGPVHLALYTVPEINSDLIYELSNGVPGNPAWLLVGFAPLNVDLSPIGAWACHLYVDPVLNIAKNITAVGTAEFVLPLPNDTSLIGKNLYAQGVAEHLAANAFGLVFTNGVDAFIGGTP